MGPGQWLDDGEGNSFSLAQLVNATRTGMHPWGWPRPGAKPASGSASSSDSGIKSPGAASGKPSPRCEKERALGCCWGGGMR